ncbi:hypothetical protein Taro_001920 [Colocasia esculenta]|uniref:SBP-type domain-containing protein n=1 Tax=Colocasia esculenta TaxID=4460 RepID=A0A843TJD6_COLES|nr:hypothetical protein [Colocasia esculenta]
MEMGSGSLGASGGSGNSDSSLHGLKFGKKIYFGDLGGGSGAGGSSSRAPTSSSAQALGRQAAPAGPAAPPVAAPKRGKGAAQGGQPQPPRCQVEGCRADLTGAKAYYCRHKVCGMHSKTPKVVVAGLEQRFCQQCSRWVSPISEPLLQCVRYSCQKDYEGYLLCKGLSQSVIMGVACRFHQLHEFDQGKRSCRRRLAGHNERRRKPTPGTLKSRYGLLSSSFHEDSGRFGNFLMDFSYPKLPGTVRDVWPTVRVDDRGSSSQWQAGHDTPSSGIMANVTHTYMQGSTGGSLFSSQEMPPGEGLGVSDSGCALSLLSTQPWGATTTMRIRAPTISDNNYGGPPMAQPGAAASFASNAWSFKVHESGSSTHEISRQAGLEQAGPGDGEFSGELELALQGDKQCMEPGHGRSACCGSMRDSALPSHLGASQQHMSTRFGGIPSIRRGRPIRRGVHTTRLIR